MLITLLPYIGQTATVWPTHAEDERPYPTLCSYHYHETVLGCLYSSMGFNDSF